MVDIRNMPFLFRLPDIQVIHIIGQFLDSFLFIYLIQNFFEPKKKSYRSNKQIMAVGSLFAVLLFLTDLIMDNNFYSYAAVMVLFPFLYACIFFRGKLMIKGLICLIFFTMMFSLESLAIYISYYLADNFFMSMDLWRILFIFRRIILKGILFFIMRILMIDVMRANAKMMNGYWYFMAGVCVTDYMILEYLKQNHKNDRQFLTQGMILSVFCIIVPMICYYMISLTVKIGEINKVTAVQETWIKAQENYLSQMEDMQKTLSQFRHDYKAHLFCMDALVVDQKYEELHCYLEKLHQFPVEKMEIIPYTANNSINLVLNQKQKIAQKEGVRFQIEAQADPISDQGGKVQIYDLNALLSNLCDNAIEVASKVKNGEVHLSLMRKKAYLKIVIENSTDGNILQKNPEFKTNKKNTQLHGLGIKIIKNIVKSYDGMYETEGTNYSLKTSILLMNKQAK